MAFFHAAGFPCFQTGFFSDERKKTSYVYISSHLKVEKGSCIVVVTYLLRVSFLSHNFEKKKKDQNKKSKSALSGFQTMRQSDKVIFVSAEKKLLVFAKFFH